jgi:putative oxidoreductase
MNNKTLSSLALTAFACLNLGATSLQSVFLLIIRLYWGWQFFQTGMGKLENITKITSFFQGLGIPFPTVNAYLAGSTECFGGLCLLLGLGSRLITIPLIFTMIVAYATAEREALFSIFTDPDKFTGADPFLFMMTAIIVFLFGPGFISVDRLLKRIFAPKPEREITGSALAPLT